MDNCYKKGTQILIEEDYDNETFKVYEGKDGEMVLLDTFSSKEEVSLFLESIEKARAGEEIVLRFI